MIDELVRLAIAARAAGEDAPGAAAADLDRLLRDDPALAAEAAELAQAVSVLRAASLPRDEARVRAAESRIRRRGATMRWAAAAAVLVAAAGAAVAVRARLPRGTEVAGGVAASPFAEAAQSLRESPFVDVPPAVPAAPAFGSRGGGTAPPAAGVLVPFAAQADFTVLALPEPSAPRVVEARFRRASAGGRPFSVAWIVYSTPKGALALIESADVPAASEAAKSLSLPEGWRSVERRVSGTLVVVASPGMDAEALAVVAAGLEPVGR